MTVELTEEQRQLLRMAAGEPLRLRDPATREEYVLLRAPVYERMKNLLYEDADADPSRAYPLIDEAFRAGWDDPRMAEYDRYEEHKGPRPCP